MRSTDGLMRQEEEVRWKEERNSEDGEGEGGREEQEEVESKIDKRVERQRPGLEPNA